MSEITIHDEIKNAVDSTDVLLFMKGSPQFPQCGFSSTVCQILQQLGIEFKSVDVLQNAEVRNGIKEFSSWPTIPQLYVKGEFLGGCDIIREMYENGELADFLTGKGVAVSA
ncbi:MAG: Grx4 family monothiol glutaredoxin [Alphaproteobacteria bacterium]|nr:Grx4 family monothiol glutaredoxin [Alphaproteobacteria bacterium]